MSNWLEARRLLFDDDENVLIADALYETGPMRQAGKLTVQPKAQYLCFSSFRPNSARRRDNVSRLHTWVVEFDHMPLDDQRRLWASTDMPHSMTVFSGGKSIHCFIRTIEDVTPEQWLQIANALHLVYPDADRKVLKDRARFARLPGGMRGEVEQKVEAIKGRTPLQTLIDWLNRQDVTKYIETEGHRDIEIKGYSKISLTSPPEGKDTAPFGLADKITAERQAQEQAFQEVPPDARGEVVRLYDRLVCHRFKAVPGQRNDLLIQMITFLHDAVSEKMGMLFAAEFWKQNQSAWNDPLDQHQAEAAAHWKTLEADYPARLTAREREIYSAIREREKVFFRICRSLAHGDDPPEGELSFFIPMQRFGHRMQIDGKQVSRLIDSFTRWGLLQLIRKGTQHTVEAGKVLHGKAGVYRWIPSAEPGGNGRLTIPSRERKAKIVIAQ